jgi:hypothetical protein
MTKMGLVLLLMTAPALALAQSGGEGSGHEGGSGSGCGDVFGDLVHVKRDAVTGQPILAKRWVELKQDSYGFDYCPIPVDGDGLEIPFADFSCDPAVPSAVVEVNYFGRLSGGRTKERNSRMHFDEVISSIKDPGVGRVSQDATGRMQLGYDCEISTTATGTLRCATWRAIDSPMENLALYARLMKYGHLQTDPGEVDTFAHGDPAAGIQYHPALAAGDYAKFDAGMRHLLPRGEIDSTLSPADFCFPGGLFSSACAAGERLLSRDFVRAGSFLAAAASKTGIITVDLVQYMNRILKITVDTEISKANVFTLPALIRDCGGANGEPYGACTTKPATASSPAPANERFVNFRATNYLRSAWRDRQLEVLQPIPDTRRWQETRGVRLTDWLSDQNGPQLVAVTGINGFVLATSDGLRAIEFVHNYAIPEDLWDFVLDRSGSTP